ncbi:MAG: amidase family protein, partial [Gammaproteobacteria bacterium]
MDVHYLPLAEVCRGMKSGALSSEDVTSRQLERIESLDSELGSFVHVLGDEALARARELDAMREEGKPLGALHGVPLA